MSASPASAARIARRAGRSRAHDARARDARAGGTRIARARARDGQRRRRRGVHRPRARGRHGARSRGDRPRAAPAARARGVRRRRPARASPARCCRCCCAIRSPIPTCSAFPAARRSARSPRCPRGSPRSSCPRRSRARSRRRCVVFGLARAGGAHAPWTATRLLLTGVVVAAGWGAVIALLLTLAPDAQLRGMLFWLIGDLSAPPLAAARARRTGRRPRRHARVRARSQRALARRRRRDGAGRRGPARDARRCMRRPRSPPRSP